MTTSAFFINKQATKEEQERRRQRLMKETKHKACHRRGNGNENMQLTQIKLLDRRGR